MTSKGLRELLDRQSRERQRMVEIAALDELNQEIRSKLDALEGSLSDLERRIRATRASFDAGDQAATHAGTDAETLELAETKRRNSFFTHLVVAAELQE